MKILHVVASLQAASGGPARSVSGVASEQSRMGHEVTIVAFDEQHLGNAVPTSGVKRVLVPSNFLSTHGRGWSPGFRRTILEQARNADIVHNHGLWMWPNAYAREAAVAAGKPLVISPRGMLEAWSLNRSRLRKAVAWQLFEKKNLRSAAMFHATAETEAEGIEDATKRLKVQETKSREKQGGKVGTREFEARIVIAPNGVDLPDLARKPDREVLETKFPELNGKRWVVFMSRLHPKKGIDVLLRAWARQKKDGAILVLAGPDLTGYRSEVERMVGGMDLRGSVVLTGELQGEAKDCLLANAEIFVLPSYSENFGIVVAEAMAWGRPVIASTGSPWKVLEEQDAGWWVDPEESELARVITRALALTREELDAKGAAGRRLVAENYSWRQAAEKLIAGYSKLVRGEGVRSEHRECTS